MPLFGRRNSGRVDFAKTLVTGVTRPLTERESWKVYWFETHAEECRKCYKPYSVYKNRMRLCKEGHELAVRVADLLFRLQRDGTVVKRSREEHQEIRVEIPAKYRHVLGLLRAIEDSDEDFVRRTMSYDRTYHVPSRPPRSSSVPSKRRNSHHSDRHYHDRREVIVEPSSPRRKSSKYRGSIYDIDQKDQERRDRRESGIRYEVYDPRHWTAYYHR